MELSSAPHRRRLRVGDVVGVRFGGYRVRGTVVELRGRIGMGRREIVGLDVDLDPTMYMEYAMEEIEDPPAERFELLPQPRGSRRPR